MTPIRPFTLAITNQGRAVYVMCHVMRDEPVRFRGVLYHADATGWLCCPAPAGEPPALPVNLCSSFILQESELMSITADKGVFSAE